MTSKEKDLMTFKTNGKRKPMEGVNTKGKRKASNRSREGK